MFAAISILDCGILPSGDLAPITLNAAITFPAAVYQQEDLAQSVPDSWAAKSIPSADSGCHLTLSLARRRVGEGRMGSTYRAEVVEISGPGGKAVTGSSQSHLPKNVCLKFAKQEHCRSLAREAWYYEQLSECQGVAVPRCFGFYTAPLRPNSDQAASSSSVGRDPPLPNAIVPWTDQRVSARHARPQRDWLEDDPSPNCKMFDSRGFRDESPWHTWVPDDAHPMIAVLVLEMGGKQWSDTWEDRPSSEKVGVKDDLRQIIEDIGVYGVWHCDISPNNIISFEEDPLTPERYCCKHEKHHRWRLVDFDRSLKMDLQNMNKEGIRILSGWDVDMLDDSAFLWFGEWE